MTVFSLIWGLLMSYFVGRCNATEGLLRTMAFTVSALAGWGVYLLVWRPSPPVDGLPFLTPWMGLTAVNLVVLQATRGPWPVTDRLAHGLVVSLLMAFLAGLLQRCLGLAIRPTRPHREDGT